MLLGAARVRCMMVRRETGRSERILLTLRLGHPGRGSSPACAM